MDTKNIIEGLKILEIYRDKSGYDIGADHDVIYGYATDKPLSSEHINKMIKLGWIQEDCIDDDEGEFLEKNYDPDESWWAYV